MKPAIIILREEQYPFAKKIAGEIDGEIHAFRLRSKKGDIFFDETGDHLRELFQMGRPILGLCASAILIRILAPLLSDKQKEPPVLAVAEDGSAFIPLLGGHHGANDMAQKLAGIFSSHAAIANAGDLTWQIALDNPPKGLILANPENIKYVSSELLSGKTAHIIADCGNEFVEWFEPLPKGKDLTIRISEKADAKGDLIYRPKTIILGVGCERHASFEELKELALACLAKANIAKECVAAIVSIDLKSDECGIHQLADFFDVPARFFSKEEINQYRDDLQNPSAQVFAEVGVYGVAEGAALAAIGKEGQLILPKQLSKRATCAIGLLDKAAGKDLPGRKSGSLSIIGIGPGQADWRVAEADKALQNAEDWVGYKLYLDLLPDWKKKRHEFPLGEEEARVRHALNLAAGGRDVALISSGDAGIYAMASLAFELMDRHKEWQRIPVRNIPGISAMQAAAARIGAPLGHDFCAISLSDLLTPWPVIENRIRAASKGDFVISFYNPVSMKRNWQLKSAKDILLKDRSPLTPVLIARNLGREGERLTLVDLGTLDPDQVDMLSLVMVGNSQSRIFQNKNGEQYFYTPRGYSAKMEAEAS